MKESKITSSTVVSGSGFITVTLDPNGDLI